MSKAQQLTNNLNEMLETLDEMQMTIITLRVKLKREISLLKLLENTEDDFKHLKLRENEK